MKRIIILFLSIILNIYFIYAQEIIPATLTRVFDGDTIEVITKQNERLIIRLVGIDCYETNNNKRAYKQAYENNISIEEVVSRGMNSKLFLIKTFKEHHDKQLYIKIKGKDDYQRILGEVFLGNININEYMLKNRKAMKYNYFKE